MQPTHPGPFWLSHYSEADLIPSPQFYVQTEGEPISPTQTNPKSILQFLQPIEFPLSHG